MPQKIQLEQLTLCAGRPLVTELSLTLRRGQVLALLGSSGCGKSLTCAAALGLLPPGVRQTAGRVLLDGIPVHGEQLRGGTVATIMQNPRSAFNPLYTMATHARETCRATGQPADDAALIAAMTAVGLENPSQLLKRYPFEMSGGMLQRMMIALALLSKAPFIFADEPTTDLDAVAQGRILDLLEEIVSSRGQGLLLVTHDMGVVSNITDRVAVMYRGDLVEIGTTEQVLGAPKHPYTQSLISAVPRSDVKLVRFPLVSYIESAEPLHSIDLKTHWLGQRQEQRDYNGALLQVDNVSLRFLTKDSMFPSRREYVQANNHVSFEIQEGETFGLVGESGSGKSTIARVITGLYPPHEGKVIFEGIDLTALKSEKERRPFRRQMQMVFQNPYSSLNPRMKVADIIAEPIRFHNLAENERQVVQIVGDLLDHVGLGRQAGLKYPHEFSGGQRQRISIARALATRPRLLICDEPTSALDVSVQAQILNLLKDLQQELKLTMLFISHDLPVIRQMCDRIGVMQKGTLLEVAKTEDLFVSPQHEYSRKLISLMPEFKGMSRAGLQIAEETAAVNQSAY
jgi:peptide/nickel transport system ATP-binding protein